MARVQQLNRSVSCRAVRDEFTQSGLSLFLQSIGYINDCWAIETIF